MTSDITKLMNCLVSNDSKAKQTANQIKHELSKIQEKLAKLAHE